MSQWHINGAIYFEKYPTESPKNTKYEATIANMAKKAGVKSAFSAYRQLREVYP